MDYCVSRGRIIEIVVCFASLWFSVLATCDQNDHEIILQRASSLYDSILVGDLESYGFNGALLNSRRNAEEICNDYKNFKESIVNMLPRCNDDRVVKSLRSSLQFICFEGKTDFFGNYECIKGSFANTQMLACSGLPTKYSAKISSQYSALTDQLKAKCKVSRYTAACLASNTTILCGGKAGDVIFNVMKHSTESVFADSVISCEVTEKSMSKVNLEISDLDTDGHFYGTTVKNPLSMEQKVPECSSGQVAATTFKLSELSRCVNPLEHFVKSRWNAIDSSKAVITRRDQTNLCSAYEDFKLCVANARLNCALIESHLAGLTRSFENFCNTPYNAIQTYNGCSKESRRATTRCIHPFMTYKAKTGISVYENVSNLCKTLVETVDCVIDSTQIFIDNCPVDASKFGVSLFMSYAAVMNVTTQIPYYTVTKGICHTQMPTWTVDAETRKLTPNKPYGSSSHEVGDGSAYFIASHKAVILAGVTVTIISWLFVS